MPQFPRRSATSYAGNVFLPFATGYYLSYLFRTINGPIADRLMAAFHLDTASLGLLTSVYFLTFAFCQLPYGPLVDRFGPRRVQAVVLAVAVLGATLFAMAPNIPTLILARALIGIGTSGALMAGLKALALWVPQERRALANGSFIMFGGLGAMTSTVPVNLLLPLTGWRGVFLLLAALTLASALLVLIVVPFPVVSRWWNGERTIDLAQTLVDHGTSLCVDLKRSCPNPRTTLRATRPRDGKRTATSDRL